MRSLSTYVTAESRSEVKLKISDGGLRESATIQIDFSPDLLNLEVKRNSKGHLESAHIVLACTTGVDRSHGVVLQIDSRLKEVARKTTKSRIKNLTWVSVHRAGDIVIFCGGGWFEIRSLKISSEEAANNFYSTSHVVSIGHVEESIHEVLLSRFSAALLVYSPHSTEPIELDRLKPRLRVVDLLTGETIGGTRFLTSGGPPSRASHCILRSEGVLWISDRWDIRFRPFSPGTPSVVPPSPVQTAAPIVKFEKNLVRVGGGGGKGNSGKSRTFSKLRMSRRPMGSSRFTLRPACGLEGWESDRDSDTISDSDVEGVDDEQFLEDLDSHAWNEGDLDKFEMGSSLENWTEAEEQLGEVFPEIHPYYIRQALHDSEHDFSLAAGVLSGSKQTEFQDDADETAAFSDDLDNDLLTFKFRKLRLMFPDLNGEVLLGILRAANGDPNAAAAMHKGMTTLPTPLDAADQTIKVSVRLRNVASLKNYDSSTDFCIKRVDVNTISITDPATRKNPKTFNFDAVFGMEEDQEMVYSKTVQPLISRCLEGYNGCIFAYGQTASGKTYTMQGPAGALDMPIGSQEHGIILRVADQISTHVRSKSSMQKADGTCSQFIVKASYLEIYNEKLSDLLAPKEISQELKIRMDPESISGKGLYVQGLSEMRIYETNDYLKLIRSGTKNRTVGETNMNEVSSRSHSILTITIDQMVMKRQGNMGTLSASSSILDFDAISDSQSGQEPLGLLGRKRSKIHLIDLAGSERADATGAVGQRLKEGSAINQSLSCLGNVISALTSSQGGQRHIPYRDSKLTYLLSDSLGGNSLTLILTCCTPTPKNYLESLSTLKFAERAKKVQNKAKVNMDPNAMRILELEAEVRSLKQALESLLANPTKKVTSCDSFTQAVAGHAVEKQTQTDAIEKKSDFVPVKKKKRFWLGICGGGRVDAVMDTY
ncbi:Kinesin-like protein kif3a [Dinochytrium kinnereticum]|nr:Kinesin-like protein kif3a [Dinochytrium kinnereticum]